MSLSDVYRERYTKPGWVYIQGSLTTRVLKFGITTNLRQRTGVNRSQKYGGIDDWELLYHVWVEQSGRVENDALARLKQHKKIMTYLKDGVHRQNAREIVECPLSVAVAALEETLSVEERHSKWRSPRSDDYEFGEGLFEDFDLFPRAQLRPANTVPGAWIYLMRTSDLQMSVRAENCLRNLEISLIGSLVIKSEAELLRVPGFGRKVLNELKELLASFGLSFSLELNWWPPENLDDLRREISPLMDTVDNLSLSVRSRNALQNADILYIGELVQLSRADLLRIPNFGFKSAKEIEEVLAGVGLALASKLPCWAPDHDGHGAATKAVSTR